jgi:hypothetical protein
MPERYAYTAIQRAGYVAVRPILPITLMYREQTHSATALLATGADINVLPHELGLRLGAIWESQTTLVTGLSGNLAKFEARGIVLRAVVGKLPPVRLAFAWTLAENVPLILGQVNFFAEFNVCFYRSQDAFEVDLKTNL